MSKPRVLQLVEYAHVTTDATAIGSPKLGAVTRATFDWLVELSERQKQPEKVLEISGDRRVRLGSMVGYLQSPDGTGIEVFPKTCFDIEDTEKARGVLQKMLSSSLGLQHKEYSSANLGTLNTPLHEWIFHMFLRSLQLLLKQGLRFDYERVNRRENFVRGRLNVVKQMRQTPAKATSFDISYDLFTPNRLENRLIKTALLYVLKACKDAENWRLANELSHRLEDIPTLFNPLIVLDNWEESKSLKHYQEIHPWCELILKNLNPAFTKGQHQGIALMFPMERLFESYLTKTLKKSLESGFKLPPQVSNTSLVSHTPAGDEIAKNWFRLKPDLLMTYGDKVSVIDIKWKLINQLLNDGGDKYSINQRDMYQLFAYGQKYQQGLGHMMLIYPKHINFTEPLPQFFFDSSLSLWVVPYCLDSDRLINGEWRKHFVGFKDSLIG